MGEGGRGGGREKFAAFKNEVIFERRKEWEATRVFLDWTYQGLQLCCPEYVRYSVSDLDANFGCLCIHWDMILCRKYFCFRSNFWLAIQGLGNNIYVEPSQYFQNKTLLSGQYCDLWSPRASDIGRGPIGQGLHKSQYFPERSVLFCLLYRKYFFFYLFYLAVFVYKSARACLCRD